MAKRDRHRLRDRVAKFIQEYRRKDSHIDPNDRTYDRELESLVKRMRPEELDRLMRDEED
ncbi:MAG: hypothetical protein IT364_12880 [Candidatus Hydrogenedentes bacterium]|nr:hypothetical protein [Candidatus Hydrogenedentota bacterium]